MLPKNALRGLRLTAGTIAMLWSVLEATTGFAFDTLMVPRPR